MVKLVASDADAYDGFYNIIANPLLWFIQHYLWDLSNAPDIRRNETEAFEFGYNAVNEDLARAVLEEIEDIEKPVVMVHDYHLYTLPGLIRRSRPDVFLHHFVHIPWSQSDSWRVLPTVIRNEIYEGILSNDIIGFHTRSYRNNFLQCCRDLMGLEVDFEGGVVAAGGPRGVGAGVSAADRLRGGAGGGGPAASARVRGRAAAPPARPPDPARRPRRPEQERPARLQRLRHLPGAASGVPREGHLHRPADAVADRRPRVRRVPGADRGGGGRGQPPPRLSRLDADPAQAPRRPRGGGGRLQALRRADGQRHVRRHEPGGQGGPDGQRARPASRSCPRTPAPTRSSASTPCR